jgi:hypothetical protein
VITRPRDNRPPRVIHVTDLGRCLIWRAGKIPERTLLRRLIRDPDASLTWPEATKLRTWLSRQIWAQKTRAVELDLLIGWTYDAEERWFITQRRRSRALRP